MAYTPELSYENSCVLRRIAWSIGKPMGFALNWVMNEVVKHIDAKEICNACKKPLNCGTCPFQEGKGRL